MLRIEPLRVSPRSRGQLPLTPPACGLRAPLGNPFPCCRSFPLQPPIMIRLLHYPWIVQLSGALAVTVRCPP
uniref:Uncharacterized protein n=1 Tax=Escherichia coli TaxID=562 RepID=A0A2P1H213_ECOLX|nr:hypothetical protein [Escherichia coli]